MSSFTAWVVFFLGRIFDIFSNSIMLWASIGVVLNSLFSSIHHPYYIFPNLLCACVLRKAIRNKYRLKGGHVLVNYLRGFGYVFLSYMVIETHICIYIYIYMYIYTPLQTIFATFDASRYCTFINCICMVTNITK